MDKQTTFPTVEPTTQELVAMIEEQQKEIEALRTKLVSLCNNLNRRLGPEHLADKGWKLSF